MRDGSWLAQHDFQWPESVIDVAPEVLAAFLPGGAAPLVWPDSEYAAPAAERTSTDIREIAAGRLTGSGVEVGAGASPYPIPLHCKVLYADRLTGTELESEAYTGQTQEDLVCPELHTDFETLAGIPDRTLDFIVACHVIEHTRNPIGALSVAWQRLRPGGQLVLVVPDMTRTFDRARALTPVSHLIDDFERPSRERDRSHYEEFYRLAFNFDKTPEEIAEAIEENFVAGYAIHYHTWTYESFGAMVEWARKRPAPFSDVWCQPTRPDPVQDLEFYYVLTK